MNEIAFLFQFNIPWNFLLFTRQMIGVFDVPLVNIFILNTTDFFNNLHK